MDIFTYIIMGLLSLDTIRAIIAMLGWVKPESKFSWIIYGRYDRNLIVEGLKELGFQPQKSKEITKNLREVSEIEKDSYGITEKNAAEQLIILIAKYIVHFDHPIQYGGTRTTTSAYYIDTMEMVHNEKDKQLMASIMTFLYSSKGNTTKPEIIITPKGGNPLFALEVANYYTADFVMAKSKSDKSRITSVTNDAYTEFQINYEGSWSILESDATRSSVVIDCNTSGASQLIDIVSDMKKIAALPQNIKITAPTEVYVLFRADSSQEHDVDGMFRDNDCRLYRFFDLDEELKEQIYNFKQSVGSDRSPDLYFANDKKCVQDIIKRMREKNLFFYSPLQKELNIKNEARACRNEIIKQK